MTHRVVQWITDVLRDREHEVTPHFHQGPESTPAACYDQRCALPWLDVGGR
ncbi:MAG TPA: hypothetical protein VHJ39_15320 [Solirubrobacteraceae bacterium]|jgi:hypothetical protein|nr:hypothetical protein [Solirubrobacteraceae bacterium]